MSMEATKKTVRQSTLTQLRQTYQGTAREEQSLYLRKRLAQELKENKAALNIAIYAPLAHEVDLLPLMQEQAQHHYLFPRCFAQGRMEFYHIRHAEQELERSKHGFLQAREGAELLDAREIDLIIVPGVAFTLEGQRIGYGGGYYDRYLLRCPQAQQIALCFRAQIHPSLPHESHDLRIPRIIVSPQ